MKAIGIDIGTTGISGILLDAENGCVLRSVTMNSNAFIKTEHNWEKLQDVDKIITIAKDILDSLICKDVCSIGVTGQMHGIVYYDKNGKSVSNLYTWQDGRGDLEYNGTTYAKVLDSCSGYGCVTDFYNLVNNLVPVNAVGYCTIADYFVMSICNKKSPILHTTNAASFGCYDLNNNKFINGYAPQITGGYDIVGKYNNIPVSVAIGDNQASVLASCREDDVLVNVGTGGQVSIISNNIIVADNIESRPFFEGKYLIVGASLCGGRAYSLLKDFFAQVFRTKIQISDDEVYQVMAEMIENIKHSTMIADTRYAGTRADKNINGKFINITTENFNPSEFIFAVLNGMARELFDLYKKMNFNKSSLVGSGNGVRKNKQFIKRSEELFGLKMMVPLYNEEASFGAAIFSLIAVGVYSGVFDAQKILKYL